VQLAVDASVLVSETLRLRSRDLLEHKHLDLVIAEEAWSETTHELDRRLDLLIVYRRPSPEDEASFRESAAEVLNNSVTVALDVLYADRLDEARRRIPRDPNDAPTVALALALDCGIWTADRDFFGCGVPVWITETLQAHLAAESSA